MSFQVTDLKVMRVLVNPRPGIAVPGALMLSSMPGRYEPLEDFVHDLVLVGIQHLLCLTPDDEIARKSPDYHQAIQAEVLPCEVHRVPIPDFGLPVGPRQFIDDLRPLWSRWIRGESIVIHCAAGCGRTSLAATAFLLLAKVPFEEAVKQVRSARAAPDTNEQRDLLASIQQLLRT